MRLSQFCQVLSSPTLPKMLECAAEVPGSFGENIWGGLKVLWFVAKMVRKIHKSSPHNQV